MLHICRLAKGGPVATTADTMAVHNILNIIL